MKTIHLTDAEVEVLLTALHRYDYILRQEEQALIPNTPSCDMYTSTSRTLQRSVLRSRREHLLSILDLVEQVSATEEEQ
jgi:hypothetical protein